MTNGEYDRVLARSRALVAEPLAIEVPVETPEKITVAPPSPVTIAVDDPANPGEW